MSRQYLSVPLARRIIFLLLMFGIGYALRASEPDWGLSSDAVDAPPQQTLATTRIVSGCLTDRVRTRRSDKARLYQLVSTEGVTRVGVYGDDLRKFIGKEIELIFHETTQSGQQLARVDRVTIISDTCSTATIAGAAAGGPRIPVLHAANRLFGLIALGAVLGVALYFIFR